MFEYVPGQISVHTERGEACALSRPWSLPWHREQLSVRSWPRVALPSLCTTQTSIHEYARADGTHKVVHVGPRSKSQLNVTRIGGHVLEQVPPQRRVSLKLSPQWLPRPVDQVVRLPPEHTVPQFVEGAGLHTTEQIVEDIHERGLACVADVDLIAQFNLEATRWHLELENPA